MTFYAGSVSQSFNPCFKGGSISNNIDAWISKLTSLLHSRDKLELISREKKDRQDYEQIADVASRMGLYSHLYTKVVVVSKVPLPNYRFDLDDKRPQREVYFPQLAKIVDFFAFY
ncbi:RNA helicase [Lithospermum erythrorhizon]|uniref:RNA helicase n=1 Tax=Lithospermum erythrorhizon TaxID=34254 RepID=A0AAV3RYQ9_LITER